MKKRLALVLFFSFFASSPLSHATLGKKADSIEADRGVLSAQRSNFSAASAYRVEEIQSPSSTIREYISSSGIVFAVAWNGMRHPELNQLLGSYFADYDLAQEQVAKHTGQRSRSVQAGDVMVQTWGHMRNLQGRAYLSSLMPAGVRTDEIK